MRLIGLAMIPSLLLSASPLWAQPEPPPAPVEPAPAPPPEAPPPAPAPAPAPAPEPGPPPPSDNTLPPLESARPYEPPPPPPEKPDSGFKLYGWSARIDPFNWLIEGRLGVELEVAPIKFMSIEVIPVFVANRKPPTFNFSGAPDVLRQDSNGLGPVSGGVFDVGFWLDGHALRGYVIRVGITNEAYTYKAEDDAGVFDEVSHTERMAFAMFGSQSRWGAFTIAGGIGLAVELNKQERCFPNGANSPTQAQTSNCDRQMSIATKRDVSETADLNGGLYPIYIIGRISLGVAFD